MRKAVVCPIIDVINDRTFAYQRGIELFRGGFNWNLQFRWYVVPPDMVKNRSKDPTKPIEYLASLFLFFQPILMDFSKQ